LALSLILRLVLEIDIYAIFLFLFLTRDSVTFSLKGVTQRIKMHIPDGFLDPIICIVTYLVMISYGVYAYVRIRDSLSIETISRMTVLASGIFVAQMIAWPIPGGTSLHFLGGGLAGILLGPYMGFFAMFLVLLVQCIVFHDGGITTLGANVLNMAIVGVLVGYWVYQAVTKIIKGRNGALIGGFLAGLFSLGLAGTVAGLEIGLSTLFVYPISLTVPVMAGYHFALGVVEGLITALVVAYLYSRGMLSTEVA